jgi:hypothetical protein
MTSGARRTIAILRDLCQRHHIRVEPIMARMTGGFDRYGDDHHLQGDFDLRREWREETLDVVAFAAVAVSRGQVRQSDPALAVYLRAARQMLSAYRAMMEPECECQGDCLCCDAPTVEGIENGC